MIILAGILFSIIMAAFVSLVSGTAWYFIDAPSFMTILLPVIFFLCVSKGGKAMGRYIISSFKKDYKYSKSELALLAKTARDTVKIILGAGCFGFVAGLVNVLVSLDNPNAIGPNLAISLITLFYSLAVGFFVFFPLQAWAENKISKFGQQDKNSVE